MLIKEIIEDRDLSGQSFETKGGGFSNCSLEGCKITLKGGRNFFENCNLKGATFSGKGLITLSNSEADELIVESSSLESIHLICWSSSIVEGRFVDVLVKDRVIGDASNSIWTNCDFDKSYTSAAKWDGADLTTCRNIRDKNNMSGALFTWKPRGFDPFTATPEEYAKWKVEMKERREREEKEIRLQKEREEKEIRLQKEREEKERWEGAQRLEREGMDLVYSTLKDLVRESKKDLTTKEVTQLLTRAYEISTILETLTNHPQYTQMVRAQNKVIRHIRSQYSWFAKAQMPRTIWNDFKVEVKDYLKEVGLMKKGSLSRSTKIKIARALCEDLHEEIKSLKDDI